MKEESGLVKQALWRFHVLDDDAASQHVQAGIFLRREILAGEDHDRKLISGVGVAQLLEKLESGHIGQSQVENDAIEALVFDRGQSFFAGGDNDDVDVVVVEQRPDTELLRRLIFDNQQAFAARTRVVA